MNSERTLTKAIATRLLRDKTDRDNLDLSGYGMIEDDVWPILEHAFRVRWCWRFDGLTTLTKIAADYLAKVKGTLGLNGLTSLPAEVAIVLGRTGRPAAAIKLNGLAFLSLESADALSMPTRRLSLNGLDEVAPRMAEILSRCTGLELDGLKSISDEVAEQLNPCGGGWWHSPETLSLNGLKQLTAASATSLSRFDGNLLLNGVKHISPDVAGGLAASGKSLHALELNGLASLSPLAAQALSGSPRRIHLNGLRYLDDTAAECLTKMPRELQLNSVTHLTDTAARHLSRHYPFETLELNGLIDLPETPGHLALAARLGQHERLDRLSEISDDTAKELSQLTGRIYLNGLKHISDTGATYLGHFNGFIEVNGIEYLSDRAANALCGLKGKIQLAGLTCLDASPGHLALLRTIVEQEYKSDVWLPGVSTCSEEAADILSKFDRGLYLDGLSEVSDVVALRLSQGDMEYISMRGLTKLTDSAGHISLAKKLSEQAGRLHLSNLMSISDEVAGILSQHRGTLELNGLKNLTDRAAEHLSRYTGRLYLNGLTSLSDAACISFSQSEAVVWMNGITTLSDVASQNLAKKAGPLFLDSLRARDPTGHDQLMSTLCQFKTVVGSFSMVGLDRKALIADEPIVNEIHSLVEASDFDRQKSDRLWYLLDQCEFSEKLANETVKLLRIAFRKNSDSGVKERAASAICRITCFKDIGALKYLIPKNWIGDEKEESHCPNAFKTPDAIQLLCDVVNDPGKIGFLGTQKWMKRHIFSWLEQLISQLPISSKIRAAASAFETLTDGLSDQDYLNSLKCESALKNYPINYLSEVACSYCGRYQLRMLDRFLGNSKMAAIRFGRHSAEMLIAELERPEHDGSARRKQAFEMLDTFSVEQLVPHREALRRFVLRGWSAATDLLLRFDAAEITLRWLLDEIENSSSVPEGLNSILRKLTTQRIDISSAEQLVPHREALRRLVLRGWSSATDLLLRFDDAEITLRWLLDEIENRRSVPIGLNSTWRKLVLCHSTPLQAFDSLPESAQRTLFADLLSRGLKNSHRQTPAERELLQYRIGGFGRLTREHIEDYLQANSWKGTSSFARKLVEPFLSKRIPAMRRFLLESNVSKEDLLKLCHDSSWSSRVLGISTLRRIPVDDQAVLAKALTLAIDSESSVRSAAVRAIGTLALTCCHSQEATKPIFERLIISLQDEKLSVRQAGAKAIFRIYKCVTPYNDIQNAGELICSARLTEEVINAAHANLSRYIERKAR